ncbi:hypothetical protein KSB_60610 [Ktedonobacter robiniae]|uniref:Uncharacterized protein n=1 Tax=Ktedonobacter robiniae TaxID=2778365 RepID=A0ABQ3UY15_9CHLR|nr:AzlD domain-containing protein [Ktedonobacter robiniae]GHO57586.1 hypothetical protein KSB_60610 [Ktedonobacter robiniae]
MAYDVRAFVWTAREAHERSTGAIFVALVAPAVFTTSIADMGAALVTLLVAVKTRNVLLAMVVGRISVLGLRWLQGNI